LPLNLAIEIHKMLSKYNKARIPVEIIRVRIGIHSAAAFVVDDVLNNKNIWGPGTKNYGHRRRRSYFIKCENFRRFKRNFRLL